MLRRHWSVRNLGRVLPVGKGDGRPQVVAGPEHGRPGGWQRAESLRRARRNADLSQRGMAARIGVSPSTVARAEMGEATVSFAVIEAILAEGGLRIVLVDDTGEVVPPMRNDAARNNGGTRYPAHLDAQLPAPGHAVFGHRHDRPKPRLTYHHRYWRDERRARLGLVPRDHSSEFDYRLLSHRGPLQRRPPWVIAYERSLHELELCRCGPECEKYCVEECPCQCEPPGCDSVDGGGLMGRDGLVEHDGLMDGGGLMDSGGAEPDENSSAGAEDS